MLGGTARRRVARAAVVVALGVALVAGCADSDAASGPAVPTFPLAGGPAAEGAAPVDQGKVPDDCARMITPADLGALLGLPLDSVAVRSTVGVPAPSVGRTERLDCLYTGTAAGPARGATLLSVNAGSYTTAAEAKAQWRRNAAAEDGAHRPVAIGAASAILVERGGEAVLTVHYGSGTLTFTLPDRPLPGDRPRGDVLVDLALRVLPALAATAPTVPPTPASGPPAPSPTSAKSTGVLVVDPARAAAGPP